MLAIAVRYLNGRAVAMHPTTRERPEWPPHPGRLFMALVAAWGHSGKDEQGRRVLEQIEAQEPPSLYVPEVGEAAPLGRYVPVNDIGIGNRDAKKAGKILPADRHKALRHFPSVPIEASQPVYFIWTEPRLDEANRVALAGLCGKVTYLGHSSSLVQVTVEDEAPAPTLVPTSRGAEHRLRVPSPGRLAELEEDFMAPMAPRRPSAGIWQGYAAPAPVERIRPRGNLAGELLVLKRASGRKLGLTSTLLLTEALRGAVLSHASTPIPECISGHDASGKPTTRPHLGFVPLPFVGHEHADGHLLGVAALLPRSLSEGEADACLAALASVEQLTFGRLGTWELESVPPGGVSHRALAPETWTGPSRRWATVTPVVLDRFPKKDGDVEAALRLACERAGLPSPADVFAVAVSPILGVPAAHEFGAVPGRPGTPRRWHTHAVLTFAEEMDGPVVLGAGRFRGYGLFRPIGETRS